jgi:pyridoxal phosphate enzyme (YggS family)
MYIERNIQEIKKRIASAAERAGRSPDEITIIAVTKGVEPPVIKIALEAGIKHVGENRVQDAKTKTECLSVLEPHPTWHMVGRLQTNKVKTAVEIFDIIHSIDSVRLADAISKRAQNVYPVLLQVNISGEEQKTGFSMTDLPKAAEEVARLPNLEVKGLMTIAPFVRNPEEVRPIFRRLQQLRDSLGRRL